MTRPTLASFKKKALNDPEVRAEYAALSAAYALRRKLIALRKSAGLTQAESRRQMLRLLAQREKEIMERHGTDLDTVLAEADALLEAEDV